MSEELDHQDTDHKELDAKVKRLEADFKLKSSSTATDSLDKRIDELEDKQNKLSEQVVTEQIKTRMQVDEIKDELDELEKKYSKIKQEVNSNHPFFESFKQNLHPLVCQFFSLSKPNSLYNWCLTFSMFVSSRIMWMNLIWKTSKTE